MSADVIILPIIRVERSAERDPNIPDVEVLIVSLPRAQAEKVKALAIEANVDDEDMAAELIVNALNSISVPRA